MVMDWHDLYGKNGYLAKSNLQIQCNSHQNSNTNLQRHGKGNSQLHVEKQKTQDRENNKRTSGEITIPDFKLCYREIVIKTAQNSYRNRQVDQ